MTIVALSVGTQLPDHHFGPIDAAAVECYARASGDDNPIHVDIEAAQAIGLDGPIVQGMLLMGLVDSALAAWLPQAHCDKLSTRFALPVAVGSPVTVAARVVRADSPEGRPRVTLRIFVRDGANKVVALAEAILTG
ncbi:MAG: MaoC family dehydratase [Phreatobacter sp.]